MVNPFRSMKEQVKLYKKMLEVKLDEEISLEKQVKILTETVNVQFTLIGLLWAKMLNMPSLVTLLLGFLGAIYFVRLVVELFFKK